MTTPFFVSSTGQLSQITDSITSRKVGEYIGTIGRSGNHCWEATDSLRAFFYTEIHSKIVERLDGLVGSLSTEKSIVVTLYMIGKRPNTAAPTVLFVSENDKHSRNARKLIKECGILKEHHGWKTSQAFKDPAWGADVALEQLASGPNMGHTAVTKGPATQVLYDISQPLRSQGMRLYIAHDSELRTMTANLVRVRGKAFYLAPAHAFFDRKDETQSRYDESEDGFEIDSDDDVETVVADVQPLECTAAELDLWDPDALSSSDESDISDTFSAQNNMDETSSQSSFETEASADNANTTNDSAMNGTLFQAGAEFQVPASNPRTPATSCLAPFGTLSRWSLDKDWALVEVLTKKRSISSFIANNPKDLSASPVASRNPAGAAIVTHTASSGALTGVMYGTPSDMCVPQGRSFQRVFAVKLNGRLADGDCGAAVLDAISGELYGHIVAGCPTNGFAYVMAAYHVMSDVLDDQPKFTSESIAANNIRAPSTDRLISEPEAIDPSRIVPQRTLSDTILPAWLSLQPLRDEPPVTTHGLRSTADNPPQLNLNLVEQYCTGIDGSFRCLKCASPYGCCPCDQVSQDFPNSARNIDLDTDKSSIFVCASICEPAHFL